MKNSKTIFLFLFLCAFATLTFAQKPKSKTVRNKRTCKVLKVGIEDSYRGSCKKGLAHGKGRAKGVDSYEGVFQNGQPHGKGVYTHATGEVYSGKWQDGLMHGEGRFSFKFEGKDSLTVGIWEEDVYIGPIPPPPYEVNYKTGVDRYSVTKIGDGQRAMIKFRQNGAFNSAVEGLLMQGSAGNQLDVPNYSTGFDNIDEFPFKCRLRYTTWNKLRTVKVNVIFDFEINEPGDWEIILHN